MDDCTVAATEDKYICDDLVMKILSRLPPKSLVVCKCVSKSWCRLVSSLIHSPFNGLFVPFYLRTGYEAIKFFNRRDNEIEVDYSLNFLPCHPDIRLVDCRDGYLLCTSENLGEQQYNYFVCNPITRQWVSLLHPPERSRSGRHKHVNAALVLDEEYSDLCYSHFKVIRFVTLYGDARWGEMSLDNIYVDVYSSQIGKWRESKALMKHIRVYLKDRPPVYLDGVLFWITTHNDSLLMYDVKEEYCQVLQLPFESGIFCVNCLGKSQGCLHYAHDNGSQMKVWMMMVGGDSTREWVLKHSINLADVNFPYLSADGDHLIWKERLEILAFHPNLDAIFIKKHGGFFWYNFNTKAVEMVACCHPSDRRFGMLFRAYPFSDCLRPLVDAQQSTRR